ncbi:DUF433 domain-containing protein [Baia soyae]|uniref:Uncharacterized protein (DUF433 family) n=1 Tax=Baia soyae TaxID=1544746 RepID=A0A4V2SYA3_9BACL|nr:DUF433 domain-containing protein [Baia soyae]TCP69261.1 uncharacterized protein (DUF433 family) [Baia soyae]
MKETQEPTLPFSLLELLEDPKWGKCINDFLHDYNGYHPNDMGMNQMKSFLRMIVSHQPGISMDQKVVSEMPVIQGTRIQVTMILACLRDGMTTEEICEDYGLTREQIQQALSFAIRVLDDPFMGS